MAMSLSTMAAAKVLAALLGLITVPRLVVPSPLAVGVEAATGVAVAVGAGSSALCPLACSHSSALHALDSGSFHTYTMPHNRSIEGPVYHSIVKALLIS